MASVTYGQFLVVSPGKSSLPGARPLRFVLNSRRNANGVRARGMKLVRGAGLQAAALENMDCTRSITLTIGQTTQVQVKFEPDTSTDLFQVGRGYAKEGDGEDGEEGNDFTVPVGQLTVSRYACRILVEREPPHRAFVFAGGFDATGTIFLGERAVSFQHVGVSNQDSDWDGLTTNGIRICRQGNDDERKGAPAEVSVMGRCYESVKKKQRTAANMPKLLLPEDASSNELHDGTVIDLCGVYLVWQSGDSMGRLAPHFDEHLDALCPVNLETIVFSSTRRQQLRRSERHKEAYVFAGCGHVHGFLEEYAEACRHGGKVPCPICRTESAYVKLRFPDEPGIDPAVVAQDHVFNPCGHAVSRACALFWGENFPFFHTEKLCPICCTTLDEERPFSKMFLSPREEG